MKKLLFLILLISPYVLSGQPFAGTQPKRMPEKYRKPNFSTIADLTPTTTLSAQKWSVWIDRAGAQTDKGETPKLMERFLVVEEKGSKIHIVLEDDSYSGAQGLFLKEPKDYGWIEKSMCVLSPNAMYSSKTNFRMKVMTITTPEMMLKQMALIKEGAKKLAFYDSPTIATPNSKETPLFEFFYILKKEGKRYLLSKKESINTGRAIDFVNGWVDSTSVQVWEQRQALEPNWDKEASEERIKLGVKSSVFSDSSMAKMFVSRKNTQDPFWNDDRYVNRYTPYFKRFPVLHKSGNILETAVVSDLIQEGSDGSTKMVKNDKMLEIQQMLNEQIAKSRAINLVFVIDGTTSMGPYLEAVRKAVIESANAVQNSDNKFKYGAVIYRDYVKPEDDACYELWKLSDFGQFASFISRVDAEKPECRDQSWSEGMYLGIQKVESILRGKEKETNVVIIIGDCGDREEPGRITESDVVPLLEKFNCGILAFQVNHKTDQSFEDFITQLSELERKNGEGVSNTLKTKYGKLNLSSLNTQPRLVQQKLTGNRNLYTLKYSPVGGSLQYVNKGQTFPGDLFKNEVKRIIFETDTANENLIANLRKLLTVVPEDMSKESGLTQEAIQLLAKAGFSYDMINILRQKNYQFMLRGHTPLKVDSLTTDLYNYVLFLDNQEYSDLRSSLDKLYDPTQTQGKRREKLKESWMELLRAQYGVSPDEIANRNLSDLMGLITGLPSLNPLLRKYKMDDLTDLNAVSDSEFNAIVDDIKKKRDQLNRLAGNKDFYFLSNDRSYYWIPQSYLP